MPGPQESLEARLLATFRIEAREHVEAMASALAAMEKTPEPAERAGLVETTFRSAHSLKGAARAVNAKDIETLCHSLESVFTVLKRLDSPVAPESFDLLHQTLDALDALLRNMEATDPTALKPPVGELSAKLEAALKTLQTPVPEVTARQAIEPARPWTDPRTAPAPNPSLEPLPERSAIDGTVRVSTNKLDAVLLQATELIPAGLAASQTASRLREFGDRFSEWRKSCTRIRPTMRQVSRNVNATEEGHENRDLSQLLEFVEQNHQFVEHLDRQLTEMCKSAEHDQRVLASMIDQLLEDTSKVAMQPFSTVLDLLPRLVREIARDQGKEIELLVHGAELEIDRRILEEMKDPLIHIVRNCVGHGIEAPENRVKAGKPTKGTITIGVSASDGATVELLVSDDGAGININALKYAVVKSGTLTAEGARALSDADAIQLIFQSGATTSATVTELSGRGLGLAIAREKVNNLNGAILVESNLGEGTTFLIVLPLTLARFRGVLVQARQAVFVLPTASIDQVVRISEGLVKTAQNRETIMVADQSVALARLSDMLSLPEIPGSEEEFPYLVAVILTFDGSRIAIGVDAVLGEQEVLVKPMGPHLAGIRDFAGATVLSNGSVAPILSITELMKRARHAGVAHGRKQAPPGMLMKERTRVVLVAEDSITSRALLKSILETAGYRVETAVDGIDAFAKLKSGEFDIVVSDVDMPRMNGFGLTARIRSDSRLSELPVVLVTSLDSESDREHGIDVGASAYIVKSSFDQSNLLKVVRQLL